MVDSMLTPVNGGWAQLIRNEVKLFQSLSNILLFIFKKEQLIIYDHKV